MSNDLVNIYPNVLAEQILGRGLDLNVGIYNPKMYHLPQGEYDFIISNPDSFRKNGDGGDGR